MFELALYVICLVASVILVRILMSYIYGKDPRRRKPILTSEDDTIKSWLFPSGDKEKATTEKSCADNDEKEQVGK